MAMIWAPMNEIDVAYLVGFSYGTVDVDIAVLAGLYTGWEVLMICIFGRSAGSSWLHLTGFALGLPMAVAMLKTRDRRLRRVGRVHRVERQLRRI